MNPRQIYRARRAEEKVVKPPTTFPQVFKWHCEECREKGEVTVTFPCHPMELANEVREEHLKTQQRRHCMCPDYGLKVAPKPLAL